MHLRNQVIFLIPREAVVQLRFVIVARHQAFEDIIDVAKRRLVAAEVLVEVDDHRVTALVLFEFAPRLHENLRIRLAESVDALLHIADLELIVRPGEAAYQIFLQLVRVLIFIDKDIFEPLPKLGRRFRILQDGYRNVLHVAEIQ